MVILKQAAAGVPIAQSVRKDNISDRTFYRWRKHSGRLEASELKQLKQLQQELL